MPCFQNCPQLYWFPHAALRKHSPWYLQTLEACLTFLEVKCQKTTCLKGWFQQNLYHASFLPPSGGQPSAVLHRLGAHPTMFSQSISAHGRPLSPIFILRLSYQSRKQALPQPDTTSLIISAKALFPKLHSEVPKGHELGVGLHFRQKTTNSPCNLRACNMPSIPFCSVRPWVSNPFPKERLWQAPTWVPVV